MPDPFASAVPFDPALAEAVRRRVAGGRTLTEACDAEGMPDRGDVLDWAEADPVFAERLDAAYRRAARFMAEDLADHCRGRNLPPGLKPATPGQRLARDRLSIVTLQMLMSIYDPQTFGGLRGFAAPPRLRLAPIGPPLRVAAAPPPCPAARAPRAPIAAAATTSERAPSPPAEDAARAAFRAEAASLSIDAAATAVLLEQAEAEGLFDAADEADKAAAPAAARPAMQASPPRRRDPRPSPPPGAFALAHPGRHALLNGVGSGALARAPFRLVPDTSPPPI